MGARRSMTILLIACAFIVSATAQDMRNPSLRFPRLPGPPDDRYIVTEKASRKVKITDEERNRYRDRTGEGVRLLKMFAAPDCFEKLTVDAGDERCVGDFDFTQVSYYSFQNREYGLGLAELAVRESDLTAAIRPGSQGWLINIGTVALGGLTKNSAEIQPYLEYEIARTHADAGKQKEGFLKGVEIDGRIARSRVDLAIGETFLMRIIRYGSFGRPGVDLTVAFRIEEKTADRTVLILWKEIREKNAPILKDDSEKKD